ncbi:hypothetical protein L5515_009023 [Caenorhabditis briggsae]|uniref:T20D4.11-like domain-containing protein n=1 Tax=Caenorhabditis briggsae TaxID=6238 RepID=A0AAE9F7R7_CAEBR|nr:hypothetical protein L5515_009023 [Caenorhabditis briggsae]
MFSYLIALLIPIVIHGTTSLKDCISEIDIACHEEMKEKFVIFKSIGSSVFPPSPSTIRNYTEKCGSVMKCASKLNCSQEHSQKEITGATCENVGVEYYFFEHQCMIPFTREVYKKEHNCAEDFEAVLRTPSIEEQPLKNESSCISKVLLKTCHHDFIEIFRKNPIKLLEPYNIKFKTNDCTSPSDKLEKMKCDGWGLGLESRLKGIPVLNASDSDVKEAMDMCRRIERCQKDACLTSRVLKEAIKQNCDYAKMISAELKNIFELHPEYSRCECLKRMSYLDVFNAYKRCTWMDQKMNCWLYAIMDSCKRPEKFALGQCPHERPSYGFPPVLFSDPPPRVFLYMSDDK